MIWKLAHHTLCWVHLPGCLLFFLLTPFWVFSQATIFQCEQTELCTAANSCERSARLDIKFNSACPIKDLHIYAYVNENNDGAYDYIASNQIPFPLANPDNLPVQPLELINTGIEAYTALLPEATYQMGDHTVSWRGASTSCHIIYSCFMTYEVVDCTPPVLEIEEYLLREPANASCAFSFSADEFVLQFADNCAIDTVIAIYPSLGPGQAYPPSGRLGTTINWCPGLGTNVMDIWAFDKSGNVSYAEGVLIITDNNHDDCCNLQSRMIEIDIRDPKENRILGVEFPHFYSYGPPIPDGHYFMDIYHWNTDNICPEKSDQPRNGVSGVDLIILARALLGLQDFTSHYQRVAADADGDGEITFFDISVIQNVILQNQDNFPDDLSWKFLSALYTFPEALQSLSLSNYPNCIPAEYALYSEEPIEMIGVKTGDLNFSATAKAAAGKQVQRAQKLITAADQFLRAGQSYSIPFYTETDEPGMGYQLNLSLAKDKIELLNSQGPKGWQGTHDWNKNSGNLSMVYFNSVAETGGKENPIFELTINLNADSWLSDLINLEGEQMAAEWYGENLVPHELALNFEARTPTTQFSTPAQVVCYPNPSKGEPIQFKFIDKYSEPINIRFINAQGRLIFVKEISNQEKNSLVQFKPSLFPSSGIYFYEIEVGEEIIQGRLVITN